MTPRRLALSLAVLWAASSAWAACPNAIEGQVDIYPTARELPENLLRIYVYFPRPMSEEEGLKNVRLLDDTGASIPSVFLANREDLWSPDRRRLTLLLDPSRIKTGLVAHEDMGRALVSGRSYAFDVSGEALDANGCPLGAGSRHEFTATVVDTDTPDPADWTLWDPRANSTEPLIVTLDSAHDHLSLAYRLRVLDPEGAIVPGAVALGEDETSWEFTPRSRWTTATYSLAIDDRLEDLAGNRPGVLFDRPPDQAPKPWNSRLEFTPTP